MNIYERKLQHFKKEGNFTIRFTYASGKKFVLVPLRDRNKSDKLIIKTLAKWRKSNARWFPSRFRVTLKGTKNWLSSSLVDNPDRILFMIRNSKGDYLGHLGFYRYNSHNKSCELDNVVRGSQSYPGLMTKATKSLIKWGFKELPIKDLFLTVFSDNKKAINLYRRCGFADFKTIPLIKKRSGEAVSFEEIKDKKQKADRYYLKMKYIK